MQTELAKILWIGLGGFAGSVLRYALGGWVHRQLTLATFPFGTLVVNLVGCLLIGVALGLSDTRQLFGPEQRAFILVGLLGGFTTFSTFGYETFAMLRDGENVRAAANVLTHVAVGLAAVWLGYAAGSTRLGT